MKVSFKEIKGFVGRIADVRSLTHAAPFRPNREINCLTVDVGRVPFIAAAVDVPYLVVIRSLWPSAAINYPSCSSRKTIRRLLQSLDCFSQTSSKL